MAIDTTTERVEAHLRCVNVDVMSKEYIRALLSERNEYLRQLDAAADLIRALTVQRDEAESTIIEMERDFRGDVAPSEESIDGR